MASAKDLVRSVDRVLAGRNRGRAMAKRAMSGGRQAGTAAGFVKIGAAGVFDTVEFKQTMNEVRDFVRSAKQAMGNSAKRLPPAHVMPNPEAVREVQRYRALEAARAAKAAKAGTKRKPASKGKGKSKR